MISTQIQTEYKEYQPIRKGRIADEIISSEKALDLLTSKSHILKAYVRLCITTQAWICRYCGEVYLKEIEICKGCYSRDYRNFYYNRELTSEEKALIHNSNSYLCWYCGLDTRNDPTIDHQLPRIQDGGHQSENLVTACRHCNSQKGGKTVEEYRGFLEKRFGTRISFYGEDYAA